MRMVILKCCGVALLLCGAVYARAPERRASAEVAQMKELARCRGITDGSQRLACYDQATATLLAAEEKADIIVVDRQEVEATNRSLFGFSLPDVSLFRRHGASIQKLDQVDGVIASASADASGQWTFRLKDGAVWHQIDTSPLPRSPRPGDAVLVKRAAFGSYMLSIDKAPAVRVRRIG